MLHRSSDLHILVVAPGRNPSDAVARAIARLGKEQRIPHEIHVIAPRERLLEVQSDFFSASNSGRFAAVCDTVGFSRDEILFNQRTFHAVGDDAAEDCTVAADGVLQRLRQLTSSEATSLTVVIAADAGLAGHVVHAALHVVGRVKDRLLLDVASSPSKSRKHALPPEQHVQVPLLLWPASERVPETFAEAVARRRVERRRIEQPDALRLDCRRRAASIGETPVPLPAMQFFWLYYLAASAGERFPLAELSHTFGSGRRPPAALTQKLSDGRTRVFPADLQRAFAQLFPMATDKFDEMFVRACGPHPGLPSTMSKINAALRRAVGVCAGPYLIRGGRGAGGYRLELPAAAIQIVR